MMEWFQQREPREQLVLGLGLVLAILIVGWRFVWTPLESGAEQLEQSVIEKSRLLVDLRRAAALRASATPAASDAGAPTLVVLVDQTARPFGLASTFTRSIPDGADHLTIVFRDAPFDVLMSWLVDLEQQHGVVPDTSASFKATGEPGLVTGRLELER
jgi:general secretion pathway protein M